MTEPGARPSPLHTALRALRPWRRARHVPHVQSLTATDCGAACIAMVCQYYGKRITLDAAREALGTGRDGTSLLGLLQGARSLGLRARALRAEIEGLRFLRPGTILFWNFNHFVVFEAVRGKRVRIVDPGLGPREIELDRFRKSFSGFCVELEPGETFLADDRRAPTGSNVVAQLRRRSSPIFWVVWLSLMLQALLLAIPAMTGLLIDTIVPHGDHDLLTWLASGALCVAAFVAMAEYVRQQILVGVRTRLDVDMSMKLLEHMLRLPFAFFQLRHAGDLLARINSMAFVRQILSSSAISALLDGSLVVLYLVLLLLASPILCAIVGVFMVLRAAILLATYRRQRLLMAEELERQALHRSFQVEMLTGIESIKASAIEDRVAERWTNLYVDATNVFISRGRLDAASTAARKGLEIGGPLAVLLCGGTLVLSGALSLGTMFTAVAISAMVFLPMDQLFQTGVEIARLKSYLERIDDVLAVEPEQDPSKVRQIQSLSGDIRVENLSFRYSSRDELVLRDINLVIQPKTTVAFVGRTGSGKSTLGKLLLGLYPPTDGTIFYGGEDLRQLDLRTVRRQIGAVVQAATVLDGSLRDNIGLSAETPLEEVVRAAKIANVHSEIMAMPMRYETRVVSGGTAFSGGQRQRIAIARAVVRRPAVLLLDEATSSLDTVTEAMVHARLSELPLTLVIIAHRLSTVRHADCIYVLERGRIVEHGRHEELLSRRGYYLDLIRHQLARESEEAQLLSIALNRS